MKNDDFRLLWTFVSVLLGNAACEGKIQNLGNEAVASSGGDGGHTEVGQGGTRSTSTTRSATIASGATQTITTCLPNGYSGCSHSKCCSNNCVNDVCLLSGATWPQTTSTGGTTSIGGTTSTGGTTVAPPCSSSVDFVALARRSIEHNWVDGTSNGCGISGAFYASADTFGSLKFPLPVDEPGGMYDSPCTQNLGCCLSGKTVLWTEMEGDVPTFREWGAALNFALQMDRDHRQSVYNGPIKGFEFTVDGYTSDQDIEVFFEREGSKMPLIVRQGAPGIWRILFTDAKCSNYGYNEVNCVDTTGGIYVVGIQLLGGYREGPFDFCLTSLKPIL